MKNILNIQDKELINKNRAYALIIRAYALIIILLYYYYYNIVLLLYYIIIILLYYIISFGWYYALWLIIHFLHIKHFWIWFWQLIQQTKWH